MANKCRYLEYRTDGEGVAFDTERAYCTAANTFVQPMRADICNYRYELDPESDCEYFDAAIASDGDGSEGR